MNFSRISSWAIKNPVPPIVLFVALTIAGMLSFMRMDVNDNPDIDFPAALVTVAQPGAAPSELETQVTQRVEAAVRGISGVDEINSNVTEGDSTTFVQFAIGTPVDRAVNDVRDAISNIRSELPDGILEPVVKRIDISGGSIAVFAVETKDMTLEQASWFVDNTIAKRLLAIPGMAQVKRFGGVDREIRVTLDPERMRAQGVTASQVNDQLRLVNMNAAGGRTEIAGSEQSVRVLANARNAYALSQTQIQLSTGRSVKLADIADVRDAYAEQRGYAQMNGRQVLAFRLIKAKGYSDVTIYHEAMKVIAGIEKESDGKVHVRQLWANVKYAIEQYESAINAMIEGAILAVVVVFIFLRDWRATVISAIAIPLSAIPTFWFLDLMGFALNALSLLALSLVAGVLVDDAIVEIENIVRHMRMGKSAYQASIDAADEIGLAVLATTMTIVAVFLPVGLMPGISGQFFKNFGLTVVVAVLMSLAVARLITPLIAAYFLKAHGAREHGGGPLMDLYMRMLAWTMAHRKTTLLAGGGGALVLTVVMVAGIPGLIKPLPFNFQPQINQDSSDIEVTMPPGSTLADTGRVVDRITAIMRRQPEIADVFASVDVTQAEVSVIYKAKRDITSGEFERKLAPALREIPDARVHFQAWNSGGNTGRDIELTLTGDDPDKLDAAAQGLVREMAKLPTLRAPRIEGALRRPEITVTPHLDLAADLGVTTAALSQTIRIATLGDIDQNVAKFSLSDRQIPIRVLLNENARRDLSTLENLPVPTITGGSVPLKVVAQIRFGSGPSQIDRYNQKRRISIGADLVPGAVAGTERARVEQLPYTRNLPLGIERASIGEAKWQEEMVSSFIVAVSSGVFLVFAVLVLLYKRVLPPLVNMSSLLLAPLGAFIALRIAGMPVSMPVLIGLLMLLGIVGKNSILLIDFALEEMNKGVPRVDAVLDAGHKRAQPIVMTTVAMVAGMVPIALSLTGDGSWRSPMAVTVMGGLILSTLLTLLIVPAGFSLAVGIENKVGPRLARWLSLGTADKTGSDHLPAPAE